MKKRPTKEPSKKQLQIRAIADILSPALERDLTGGEFGQIGKLLKDFGYALVEEAALIFQNIGMPVKEKRKCAIRYMFGCIKKSKTPSNQDKSLIKRIIAVEMEEDDF